MKYKLVILIYLFLTTPIFSQSPKTDFVILSKTETTQMDSSNITVPIKGLLNINRIDKILSTGVRWSAYGLGAGVLIGLSMDKKGDCNLGCFAVAVLGGFVGVASGLIYGTVSNIPNGYNVGKYRIGLQSNVGETMANTSYRFVGNFGMVFRYPNKLYYFPDAYTIYFGGEELRENTIKNKFSSLNQTKYGIQLRKIGYNRIISFLYGVDFGISKGTYSYSIQDNFSYYSSKWKNISTFYFDLIVGINLNLTNNISASLEYQHEIYGAGNDVGVLSVFHNPARGVTSFSVYTFLW